MRRGRTDGVLTEHLSEAEVRRGPDQLVVEEHLEIRLDGHLVATTMRTPGHDFELAAGFCHAEGVLAGAPVRRVRYCGTGGAAATGYNVATVETGGMAPTPAARLQAATAACGTCGVSDVDALVDRLGPLVVATPIPLEVSLSIPDRVRPHQELFEATGASHAAAVFDAGGEVLLVREDIGRHNAVDKVVGRLLLDGDLPCQIAVGERPSLGLFVSGRASFEMVQKAWAAGFATLVAVSAPSALAVSTARLAGLEVIGFARAGEGRRYSPAP